MDNEEIDSELIRRYEEMLRRGERRYFDAEDLEDIAVTDIDGTGETWLLSTPYTSFTVSSSEAGVTIGGSGSARGLTLFATNHYATAALSGWSLSQGDFSPLTVDLGQGILRVMEAEHRDMHPELTSEGGYLVPTDD